MNNINQTLFVFFVSGRKGCQYCSICSAPLAVIKFLIIFIFVEFLIKKLFEICSARTHTDAWCICCFQCCKWSSWSGLCMSSPSPLYRLAKQHFDERCKRKQSESFLSQPEHTIWVSKHRTLTKQCFHLGVFLWKQYIIFAIYRDFCKLQSFWFCTPLLTLTLSLFSGTYLIKLPSS